MTLHSLLMASALTLATTLATQAAELRASHNANADEPYGVGLDKMAEIVAKDTDGSLTIKSFPNAQLGDEMESIQGTQMGTVDIAVAANEALANFAPDLATFSLPYIFKSSEQMDKALNDPKIFNLVSTILEERGFKLLALFSAGERHIMTKKPINSIDDLKGEKIRVIQNPAHIDAFKAFGANPAPLPYTELYGALETGVVDGADAANTNYYSQKFYEVAPDWAMVGWLQLVAPVVMGKAAFDKLPADQQKALLDAGMQAGSFERQYYVKSDAEKLEKLKEAGVTITHPDTAPFREAAAGVKEKYLDDDRKKELYEMINAVN
ncbi:TRAP transporter substrate-binding protein [Thioclava sp. GXIMD2076]|uniref:TRAP transporter substrate-binding protein n=1 Tax=Thioclava sp. GXIMD2076 TaxID=3131931 RepID=UPI0030D21E18